LSFSELGVSAELVVALEARGITAPFPVQTATIADGLAGHDLCVEAPTGSGKTLAFGIPLVARVGRAAPKRPRALVLAPTRELAAQISAELAPLATTRRKRVLAVYGGVGYEQQLRALRRGVEILVACPGRLQDLVDRAAVVLDQIEIVVIDEADRMADMGFLPVVRKLIDRTPSTRQTLLFSATLDGDISALTTGYQRDPRRHTVAAAAGQEQKLEHRFVDLEPGALVDHTAELIRAEGPTIVFCRTRHRADRISKQLRAAGIEAAAIHGGLSQNKRDQTLARFKAARLSAIVATDVAARGVHVDDVACVVHFDLPADAKTYVHRSGRTGRAGATGTVVSLVTREQRAEGRALRAQFAPSEADKSRAHNERAARPANPRSGRRRSRNPRRTRSAS
jgi:superfamily II DNA/RNA helicase